jgi:hypothetical protein
MAAALALAGLPVVLFVWPDRPRPVAAPQALSTFNAAEPPALAKVDYPAAPVAPPPAPPAAPRAPGPVESEPPDSPAPVRPGSVIPETRPRIAYSYGYRFRVPGDSLAAVQERHLQICLSLGEARCRVVSMRRSEPHPQARPPVRDQGYGGAPVEQEPAASLEVQVASPLADAFGRRLTQSAGAAGGEIVDRQIGAEDLARDMVDSEARIRTREILIRRLSTLLQTRSGNIEQAVQAERAINEAQEELEAARARLAEMRGRVAMSKIAIFYESAGAAAAPVQRDPIGKALGQVSAVTAQSVAVLLLIVGLTLPWAAAGVLIWFLARWHRRRADRAKA